MLTEITSGIYDIELDIVYATERNFTQQRIYSRGACYLHPDAVEKLDNTIRLAKILGYKVKIFDAFRPLEAQWLLWEKNPNPNFLSDPKKGSPHSRGVAIDLTLVDRYGADLDMGSKFDEFCETSHHGNLDISPLAQKNRSILLGIMTSAGWDFYRNEWWHYQLYDARKNYSLISDKDLSLSMMFQSDMKRLQAAYNL
jgi:D-alanyl-D-alanine dipeptidase